MIDGEPLAEIVPDRDSQRNTRSAIMERYKLALNLRIGGKRYDEIGDELKLTPRRALGEARRIVNKATKSLVEMDPENLRRMQMARLEFLWQIMASKAEASGDPRTAECCVKILERQSMLRGLDDPRREQKTIDARVETRVKLDLTGLPEYLLAGKPVEGPNRVIEIEPQPLKELTDGDVHVLALQERSNRLQALRGKAAG